MNDPYHDILNECLDAVMRRELTITQCVTRYPHYAEALRYDLGMMVLLRRVQTPQMDAAKVNALDARLRKSMKPKGFVFPQWLGRRVAAVVIVVVILFAAGGGTVAASSNSLPGDTLYAVKRLWEAIIVLVAQITGQVDEVYVDLAETRLEEVQALVAEGELDAAHLDALRDAMAKALEHVQPDSQFALDQLVMQTQTTLILWQSQALSPEIAQAADPIYALIEPALTDLANRPENGSPMTLVSATPPPSDTPSITPTRDLTLSATPSATLSPTVTDTPSLTATWTPRYAPTATRTPTITPTEDMRPTVTPTWTPYPTSTIRLTIPVAQPTSGGFLPAATATSRPPTRTPIPTWYPWVQATYDACYLLQTVDPQAAENNPHCP